MAGLKPLLSREKRRALIELINVSLLAFMAVLAVAIARLRNLFAALMLSSFFSILCAAVFLVLDRGGRRLHRGRRWAPASPPCWDWGLWS